MIWIHCKFVDYCVSLNWIFGTRTGKSYKVIAYSKLSDDSLMVCHSPSHTAGYLLIFWALFTTQWVTVFLSYFSFDFCLAEIILSITTSYPFCTSWHIFYGKRLNHYPDIKKFAKVNCTWNKNKTCYYMTSVSEKDWLTTSSPGIRIHLIFRLQNPNPFKKLESESIFFKSDGIQESN